MHKLKWFKVKINGRYNLERVLVKELIAKRDSTKSSSKEALHIVVEGRLKGGRLTNSISMESIEDK